MVNLTYTVKQIYNDDNIQLKPYPYCPICQKPINLIANIYNDNIYYEITCTCKHYIYIREQDLTEVIKKWNQHCTDEINHRYVQLIHNNIVTIDFGLSAIFIGIICWLQNINLLPLLAVIIYIPYFFSCLLDTNFVNSLIKQHIINKTIDNSSFYLPDKINIQEQVNRIKDLYNVMNDLIYKSVSSTIIKSTINILIQNFNYFKNHVNDISNEYIHTLNKFYHILSSMNIDEDSNIFNDFYKYFKQVSLDISTLQQIEIKKIKSELFE